MATTKASTVPDVVVLRFRTQIVLALAGPTACESGLRSVGALPKTETVQRDAVGEVRHQE